MRFFLAYLTATDQEDYAVDFQNFRYLSRYAPGVDVVDIVLTISRVGEDAEADRIAIRGLLNTIQSCPWLNILAVIWKGNIGRDFSSAEASLRYIGQYASAEDFIMIRNRSATGPFCRDWYKSYMQLYRRNSNIGLVGSTINLVGHADRPSGGNPMHVQTYVYMSQWKHLQGLTIAYPGAQCVERLNLIVDGEIGLSQRIIGSGLSIACLAWPEHIFNWESSIASELPRRDIKREAKGLPLRYRYRPIYTRPSDILASWAWRWALKIGGVESVSPVPCEINDATYDSPIDLRNSEHIRNQQAG